MTRKQSCPHGMTLVELITALAFSSVVGLMTHTWARAVITDGRRQHATAEAEEALGLTVDMIAGEIRGAGFSKRGDVLTALSFAGPERVDLQSDLDGDGGFVSSNERISYSYRSSNRQLTRATGAGSGQLLLDEVPANGFRLRYFDANGGELANNAGLAETERRAVRRIDVQINVERRTPSGELLAKANGSVSISLRNPWQQP